MIPEADKPILKAFVANKRMFDAVRRVLLSGIANTDSDKHWLWDVDEKQDDAAFGREVKLTRKAIDLIQSGFDDIARLSESNPQPDAMMNESR